LTTERERCRKRERERERKRERESILWGLRRGVAQSLGSRPAIIMPSRVNLDGIRWEMMGGPSEELPPKPCDGPYSLVVEPSSEVRALNSGYFTSPSMCGFERSLA